MAVSLGRKLVTKSKQIPTFFTSNLTRKIPRQNEEDFQTELFTRSANASNNVMISFKNASFASRITVLFRSPAAVSRSGRAFLCPDSSERVLRRNFASGSQDPLGPFKSDKDDDGDKKPLKLMDFNELIWPHPLKTLRNYFFSWLIRGYFDQHFSRENFLNGTEQAVSHVANLISQGNFEALEGLVAKEAIKEVRQSYQNLSLKQRKFIAVNPKDLFFRFIYEIGLIFDDTNNRRYVEITAVLQGLHGLDDSRQKNPDTYVEEISKAQDQVYVCNYRFIREYTKGKTDDWTINKLNHFSPKEIVRDKGIFTLYPSMRKPVPVPSQDKGGGFCGGLATHPGKKTASNRNNAEEEKLRCPMCSSAREGLTTLWRRELRKGRQRGNFWGRKGLEWIDNNYRKLIQRHSDQRHFQPTASILG